MPDVQLTAAGCMQLTSEGAGRGCRCCLSWLVTELRDTPDAGGVTGGAFAGAERCVTSPLQAQGHPQQPAETCGHSTTTAATLQLGHSCCLSASSVTPAGLQASSALSASFQLLDCGCCSGPAVLQRACLSAL